MSALTRTETLRLLALVRSVRDVTTHCASTPEGEAEADRAFSVLREHVRALGPDLVERGPAFETSCSPPG